MDLPHTTRGKRGNEGFSNLSALRDGASFWLQTSPLNKFPFPSHSSHMFSLLLSCSPALHFTLLPVAPGLSLSINPSPHLSLIHSEGRKPLRDCGVQTGLCSNRRVRALFQRLYLALRKRCFIAYDMEKKKRKKKDGIHCLFD